MQCIYLIHTYKHKYIQIFDVCIRYMCVMCNRLSREGMALQSRHREQTKKLQNSIEENGKLQGIFRFALSFGFIQTYIYSYLM